MNQEYRDLIYTYWNVFNTNDDPTKSIFEVIGIEDESLPYGWLLRFNNKSYIHQKRTGNICESILKLMDEDLKLNIQKYLVEHV
jgi:hypothetical protein